MNIYDLQMTFEASLTGGLLSLLQDKSRSRALEESGLAVVFLIQDHACHARLHIAAKSLIDMY